ncbi:HEAT repeat domain-containing protein [Pseudodesulfovibrio pelocollis]|uniref:HEAT repeat domain-containing protein n=1 Tax=Pseudodesulfovibrio pelocollis TaxID=3051432 RepID=UPI00255B0968|nr:HEAT repeat domain-containing protein [Pseudodesulfovibrio sp. SB368]
MKFAIRLFVRFLPVLCFLLTAGMGLASPGVTSSGMTDPGETGPGVNPEIPALADILGGTDPEARARAVVRLKAMGQPAMPGLVAALAEGDAVRRRGAALGLGLLPAPGLADKAIVAALADPDTTVRSMAAHASAAAGPDMAPGLVGLLADPDPSRRDAAAYGLSLMGRKAVPALAAGLAAPDAFARAKAAWLLGHLGQDAAPAIPALIRALDTDDQRVVHVLAEAIDTISPPPALVWHHLMLLGAPCSGLYPQARLGRAAAPILVRLLDRPGTPLAQTAFRALLGIGNDAIPALSRAVATGTPSQRTGAALLLSDIDPASVLSLPEDLRQSLSGLRHQP